MSKWLEDYFGGRYAKISSVTGTTGALTLGVTGAGSSSAYIFTVGDVIINARTGERMEVATVAGATTITIASGGRSIGATAAQTPAVEDGLYIIGSASEEGATARNVNSTQAGTQSNYTRFGCLE